MSLKDIENLVAEVEEDLARTRQTAAQLHRARVKQPIERGMGTVVVSGYGRLLDVELDPMAIRHADPRRLGSYIVNALKAAEAKAEQTRADRFNEIRRTAG
ncbi:MAG: hypothetical protein GEV03_17535 [Streptosporangiales bacterium]|nr:hypothetical protein [Streptosporangiales bacterium]